MELALDFMIGQERHILFVNMIQQVSVFPLSQLDYRELHVLHKHSINTLGIQQLISVRYAMLQ